jgi:hypothetical protein
MFVEVSNTSAFNNLAQVVAGHRQHVAKVMAEVVKQHQEQEAKMYNQTPEQEAREHLRSRLRAVKYEVIERLQKDYGLTGDDRPKNAKELAERLASGKFVVRGANDEDQKELWSLSSVIEWRDPKVTKDEAGFKAAAEKVKKAYVEAKDQIVVKTPEEGLKALQGFEKAKFN